MFLILALAACFGAHAKGIFQAQGTITDVQRSGDTLTFRFVGDIGFGYASAPDTHPKRRWRDIHWDFVDIPMRIGDWTRRYKPEERDDKPDVEAAKAELANAAGGGRKVRFSIDNPGLSFSNRGQLVGVSGTYIYPTPWR